MKFNKNKFGYDSLFYRSVLNFTIFLISCILFLFLAELTIRLLQYFRHDKEFISVSSFYRYDSNLNLRIPVANKKSNKLNTDRYGFRNPELATPKPRNMIRIAFIGGSTTFSGDASNDKSTWPYLVVEKIRNKFPNQIFDYINAGVSGYTTSTSLRNLNLRVINHNPDVVIIYHATNDLSKNSRKVASKKRLENLNLQDNLSWLTEYSLLFELLEKNIYTLKIQSQLNDPTNKLKIPMHFVSDPFRKTLSELAGRAKEIADASILVTFSARIRREQSVAEKLEAAVSSIYYMPYFTPSEMVLHFEEYNSIIRDVGRNLNILVIENEHSIPATSQYFVDSVHFTDDGNKLMAERIANGLIEGKVFEKIIKSRNY